MASQDSTKCEEVESRLRTSLGCASVSEAVLLEGCQKSRCEHAGEATGLKSQEVPETASGNGAEVLIGARSSEVLEEEQYPLETEDANEVLVDEIQDSKGDGPDTAKGGTEATEVPIGSPFEENPAVAAPSEVPRSIPKDIDGLEWIKSGQVNKKSGGIVRRWQPRLLRLERDCLKYFRVKPDGNRVRRDIRIRERFIFVFALPFLFCLSIMSTFCDAFGVLFSSFSDTLIEI